MQIICGIGQVLGNLVLLTEVLKHLAKVKVLKTPVTYFNAFYGMTNILMSLSVSWWLWRKQKIVQKIADKTLTANTDPKIKVIELIFTALNSTCIGINHNLTIFVLFLSEISFGFHDNLLRYSQYIVIYKHYFRRAYISKPLIYSEFLVG